MLMSQIFINDFKGISQGSLLNLIVVEQLHWKGFEIYS